MKRIEFIAPVEAMRGNLSGKQTLTYPLHDNSAYDAPVGKHYATNYQPSFIGAKRASDGLKYFALKRRNAIRVTATQKKNWAVTGACGAIVAAILDNKSGELYTKLMQLYDAGMRSVNGKQSFRAMLSDTIMKGLRAKQSLFFFVGPAGGQIVDASFNNPYVSGGTAPYNVTISNEVLVKFWSELANDPVLFTVAGQTGIAHNELFETLVSSNHNVLGLTIDNREVESEMVGAVMMGDQLVKTSSGTQVLGTDQPTDGANYILAEDE